MVPNRGDGFDSFPGPPGGQFRYGAEDGSHDGQLQFSQGDYLPALHISHQNQNLSQTPTPIYNSPSISPFRAVPNPSYSGHVEDVFYAPPQKPEPSVNRSTFIRPPQAPPLNANYVYQTPRPTCCVGGNFQGNHHHQCTIALLMFAESYRTPAMHSQPLNQQFYAENYPDQFNQELPQRSTSTQPAAYPKSTHRPSTRLRAHSMPHNPAELEIDHSTYFQSPLVQSPMQQESESPHNLAHSLTTENVAETKATNLLEESQAENKAEVKPYTRQFTLTHNRALDLKPL